MSFATPMKETREPLWIARFSKGIPCGDRSDDNQRLCDRCKARHLLYPGRIPPGDRSAGDRHRGRPETRAARQKILGSDFDYDIEIKFGAGAFVCGEETALIHSMEGQRGEPTSKPPFPAESGYWNQPTSVNNVETFASVAPIIRNGAKWFNSIGTEKSKGTKVFALAGKIKNVGLVEVPMGTTLREVIFDIGGGLEEGKKFKAVQTGGPSGGALTAKNLDVPIDYDNLIACGSMMGSGGMIVMDDDDCMVAVAKFFTEFTMDETCGKCTPCRIGSKRLYEILDRITSGLGTPEDLDRLRSLGGVIKDTALCGLGQSMPNPILSTINNFEDEYLAHINESICPTRTCKICSISLSTKKNVSVAVCAHGSAR